ncbi:MAG: SAM-dependent DNA methyltransferase [Candidatus Sumerlaeia bacterium]|nr:SAM-dependent DNA methyltransferase [Candidatus Sumerlaeia bacterium]
MDHSTHNTIVSFIWGIADDVLRDVFVRGKYRDVILPMTVIRRLDCLLEPTQDKVLQTDAFLEGKKITQKAAALSKASGYPFYNTSRFTLRRLLDEPSQVEANFREYLRGFSDNVVQIIDKFKFRNQLETLVEANCLYPLIQKFTHKDINLSPEPALHDDGTVRLPGLTNLGMGYVFEELIRKFNEENNEEAGEHFTPRDIIRLMTNVLFLPIADKIESSTYLVYDPACGSGGMLTEAEAALMELAESHGKQVRLELFGQEVNPETFAICQSDMLIKGENPANIVYGSTLRADGFPQLDFDFMLSNPPYGKSWKLDQDSIVSGGGTKKEILDSRYAVGVPRSSDGQLLFLSTMLSKMKKNTPLGSRVASVHNGSALFTGDAGSGESEIRRWILENDWLEAIIGLPLRMFYNTGIATYIWVLSNKKEPRRKGKVQLIDATQWYSPMRRNLGQKGHEFTEDQIRRIADTFLAFEETENSKIFDNEDFGFRKITVERPLRLRVDTSAASLSRLRDACGKKDKALAEFMEAIAPSLTNVPADNWNEVVSRIEALAKDRGLKLSAKYLKLLQDHLATKEESAQPVLTPEALKTLRKKSSSFIPQPSSFVCDSELRDTENVPLKENVEEYFAREVLPHVPDAWIDHEKTTIGYEISFTRVFYKYQPLRSLDEIIGDIMALEKETEGLLHEIVDDLQGVKADV